MIMTIVNDAEMELNDHSMLTIVSKSWSCSEEIICGHTQDNLAKYLLTILFVDFHTIMAVVPDILRELGYIYYWFSFQTDCTKDVRYRQFLIDVKGLETRLKELKSALQSAFKRYEHPDLAYDLERDTISLVGMSNSFRYWVIRLQI